MLKIISHGILCSVRPNLKVRAQLWTQVQKAKLQKPEQRPFALSFPEAVNEKFDNFISSSPGKEDLERFVREADSLPSFKNKAFDATLMKRCVHQGNFRVGRMFLQYLKETGRKPNIATLSRYLELCYRCPDEASVSEVEDICNQIKQFTYLDLNTTESLVLGLCLTSSWKESATYLKKVESIGIPGSLAYSAFAQTAILNGEFRYALEIMIQVVNCQRFLHDFVYLAWIDRSDANNLFLLLDFWGTNEIFPSKQVVLKLIEKLRPLGWDVVETKITQRGNCAHCREQLKTACLTSEQIEILKDEFFKKVVTGPDAFIGSSPEEIGRFQSLVERRAPFDVVIDGLNVIYKRDLPGAKNKMETLKAVVNHFANLKKNVLVLGKAHLKHWSTPIMKDIRSKAAVFLTENLSRDDPFLLYAALYSGAGTQILSHDLMRDHAFRLRNPALSALFRQWRRSCQLDLIAIAKNGRVVLQHPLNHLTAAQQNSQHCWHVPYDDGSPRFSHQLPTTWLCLRKKES